MKRAALPASIRRIARRFSGTLGLSARELATGREITLNADEVFPTASMAKIPILLELYRQHQSQGLSLAKMVTVRKPVKVGGSGVIVYMDEVRLSLHDLAVLMMTVSDNTATNVLMQGLGIANINRMMQDAGLTNTRLHRKIRMKLPDKPKHPFFAISAADGSYTITGVPPGKYTVVAWHEASAGPGTEKTMEVTVPAKGTATANFSFGASAALQGQPSSLRMLAAIEFPMLHK